MAVKIKVVHFHNGKQGGVFSVIRNLLRYSKNPAIENHVIYVINKKQNSSFHLHGLEGAASEQVFYYSRNWNFYHTCRELAKLLPANALIVAHDWLELGMVSNLGLQNSVVQFLHGNYDYYYKLTQLHQYSIDQFICISKTIFQTLCKHLPKRVEDISCRFFPVPNLRKTEKTNKSFNIYYGVVDLEDNRKQFGVISKIDEQLRSKSIFVNWTIVGSYSEKITCKKLNALQNVQHFVRLTNEEIIGLLQSQHAFILPSFNEGLPVSLIEAMKAGLVPLIPKWENAVEDIVIDGETGYYIENTDIEKYAIIINELINDSNQWKRISTNAISKANEQFDPFKNTAAIEEIIINATMKKFKKNKKKVYGSRLDNEYLPNWLVNGLRNKLSFE